MALPDSDGKRDELVQAWKRRRKLATVGAVISLAVLAVALYFYLRQVVPPATTLTEELAQVQQCDMDLLTVHYDRRGRLIGKTPLSRKCKLMLSRLLRRLVLHPEACARVRSTLAAQTDWERQNRLLHVLLRYLRAINSEDAPVTMADVSRNRCVEDAVVLVVKKWHANKRTDALVPGLSGYNNRLLRHLSFLVVNTYVLKRVPLQRGSARRLAAHLLGQYRKLNQGATGEVKERLKTLFTEVFYPLWDKLGKPDPNAPK